MAEDFKDREGGLDNWNDILLDYVVEPVQAWAKRNKLMPLDEAFDLDEEDKKWINDPPVGKEVID